MELCHIDILLQSAAARQVAEFMQQRRESGAEPLGVSSGNSFEQFEHEVHELVMALERELVSEELSRYDVTAEEIEVNGRVYRCGISLPETYLTAAGRVVVERHRYYPVTEPGRSLCPLELRSGIIGGYFTPRSARQAAFAMAHLTPGESEALFAEMGNMQPSRSSLDRLTKELSPRWESHRVEWEAQVRQADRVPPEAQLVAVSLDGVMSPIRGADKAAKAAQPGKHASGPTGYKEVGCGTVTFYDQEAERLHTIRYARMPESKKVTLQQQLDLEVASILTQRPDLQRVYLADGAKDNWRLLAELDSQWPVATQPPVEIVDFYHACDHLKEGCDAAWGESTLESQSYFERLKTWLKEKDKGAQRVIRTLRFQSHLASGNKRRRLEAALTYFRNQAPRMRYADYVRQHLPIASGVMEASCKTLVTQRLKRSGMAWTLPGGQAILTLRSLIQSDRWASAWSLLSADFRQEVHVRNQPKQPAMKAATFSRTPAVALPSPVQPGGTADHVALLRAA